MLLSLFSWLRCRSGATAIEYGLIAGGIALVIAVAVFAFGDELHSLYFDDLTSALDGEAN